MKTFIYTKKTGQTSKRTYATPYTLAVYLIVNKNTIKPLGTVETDNQHHKGELNEAWIRIFESLPARTKNKIRRFCDESERSVNYFCKSIGEAFSIEIEEV